MRPNDSILYPAQSCAGSQSWSEIALKHAEIRSEVVGGDYIGRITWKHPVTKLVPHWSSCIVLPQWRKMRTNRFKGRNIKLRTTERRQYRSWCSLSDRAAFFRFLEIRRVSRTLASPASFEFQTVGERPCHPWMTSRWIAECAGSCWAMGAGYTHFYYL